MEAKAEVEAPDHIDVEVVLKLEVTEEVDQVRETAKKIYFFVVRPLRPSPPGPPL